MAHILGVERACLVDVIRPFDDGSTVRENGHLMLSQLQPHQEFITADRPRRPQSPGQISQIQLASDSLGPNLHRMTPAQTDGAQRTPARQELELPVPTALTSEGDSDVRANPEATAVVATEVSTMARARSRVSTMTASFKISSP